MSLSALVRRKKNRERTIVRSRRVSARLSASSSRRVRGRCGRHDGSGCACPVASRDSATAPGVGFRRDLTRTMGSSVP